MNKMIKSNKFTKLIQDKKGATMVEYAILLFLILVIAAVVYKSVGKSVCTAGTSTAAQFN
jgi:Flp pilus assembly pilin Flp